MSFVTAGLRRKCSIVDNLKALKIVAIISLAILAMVAFALGFYPLEESARRGGIGIPVLLPVLVDLGLVLMGLGAMAARANRLTAWPMRAMAAILILVSAFVQYFHASSQPNASIIDIVVSILPPIVLWAASSAVETLLFGQSVNNAVAKADQEAARKEARLKARNTPKSTGATPTPKPVKSTTQPKNTQEAKPVTPSLEIPRSVFEEKQKPETIEKAKKPANAAPKKSSVSDTELQEAIALVIEGNPLSTVAKQYGIARSTLGRKVEAAKLEMVDA